MKQRDLGNRTVKPNEETIRQRRTAKGWSVDDLASNSGIASRTIQRIESGEECFRSTINLLAKSLDVKPEDLLGEPTPRLSNDETELEMRVSVSLSGNPVVARPFFSALQGFLGNEVTIGEPIDDGHKLEITLRMNPRKMLAVAAMLSGVKTSVQALGALDIVCVVDNTESMINALNLSLLESYTPTFHFPCGSYLPAEFQGMEVTPSKKKP